MTTKHRCSAKTPDMDGRPNASPCLRSATVQHNGKWYCWQHDPERVAEEAVERRAAWEAKMDRETAKYTRIAHNARLGALVTPELSALLERLAGYACHAAHAAKGFPGDVDEAYNDEEITRALAARIREAPKEHDEG